MKKKKVKKSNFFNTNFFFEKKNENKVVRKKKTLKYFSLEKIIRFNNKIFFKGKTNTHSSPIYLILKTRTHDQTEEIVCGETI